MNEKCIISNEVEKCYSLDEEVFHADWCSMTDYGDVELKVGDEYWEADRVPETHEGNIGENTVYSILEGLDESLSWDHGDYFDNCYLQATPEEREELRQLIIGWANKNIKMSLYRVVNPVKKIVTQEDLE